MDLDNISLEQIEKLPYEEKAELLRLLEEREKLRVRDEARDNFMSFVNSVWPQFIGGEHHAIMADAFQRIKDGTLKRLIISMPPRHALALDTVVPTPSGLTTVADLKTGDYVFGPDGQPTMVVGKSEIFEDKPCWRVRVEGREPSEVTDIVADAEHRWYVATDERSEDWRMVTTEELWERQVAGLPPMTSPEMKVTINGTEYSAKGRRLILEPTFNRDTQCIKVDRQDELFVVGHDLVVTANTKSEFSSWLLPAWMLGHRPDMKILHASHTQDLTANFGRKIRDLIDEDTYKEIFPDTVLKADAKSSGKWQTAAGGQYYAAGVGGALAGRGADLAIIDDPISEQDVTDGAFEQCWEWFQSGPRQRLQPGGVIVIIMTRWSRKDLVGKLLSRMEKDPLAEQYEYIEFPALLYEKGYEDNDDHIVDSLWPEYWDKESMLAVKRSISPHLWNAQYMQRPTGKGSSVIPREHIKRWPSDRPWPTVEFLLHSYDPAFEEKEGLDPTGFTKWAVFRPVGVINGKSYDGSKRHFICLGSLKKRMDFPDLKRMALAQYRADKPDTVVIEKRASGAPMIQELQRAGIFIESFTPHRGTGDKTVRLNAVASMFEEGLIWIPEGPMWADELIDDIVGYPNMEDDDLVDSTTMALERFKRGNLVSYNTDQDDDDDDHPRRPRRYYNV